MITKLKKLAILAIVAAMAVFLPLGGGQALADHTSPGTIFVVDVDPCLGTGTGTLGDPFCSIQDAVEHAAIAGDTIEIRSGTYQENLLVADKSLTLSGAGPGEGSTILSGELSQLPVIGVISFFADVDVTISGLTITGGSSSFGGGGIANLVLGASVGTVTLINSTVSGNEAINGNGGGIQNFGFRASVALINSTVSGNEAVNGGGIDNFLGMLTLINSTVSANIGGGIHTVGPVDLTNTIIANNSSDDCSSDFLFDFVSLGHNLASDTTCNLGAAGDLPMTLPLLGDLANNGGPTFTHALLTDSPAIDAGDDASCPATDQRGVARPIDGDGDDTATCDIGAYEFEFPGATAWVTFSVFEIKKAHVKIEDGKFKLKGIFTLGGDSDGIDPVYEDVSLQVGTFPTTIPAGFFTGKHGMFKFKGSIEGVDLKIKIKALGGGTFDLKAEGEGADLTATGNPVTVVGLTIGDDTGSISVEE